MSKTWPTIRKQKRGDWVVDCGLAFGGRVTSTRQTLPEAKEVAAFYRNEKKRLGALGGKLKPSEILEVVRCREILNGRSLTEAVEYYVRHHSMRVTSHTLKETIEALVEQQEKKNRRPRTISSSRTSLQKFASWFGQEGGDVARFDAEIIQGWLDAMAFSPATECSYIRQLSGMFSFAVKRGWREDNPMDKIEKPIVERGQNRILTVQETTALLNRAMKVCPYDIPGIAVQLFGGLRPEETRKTTLDDWDEAGKTLHVRAEVSKVRQERYVTVEENLRLHLAHFGGFCLCDDPLLNGGSDGRRRALCKDVGITWSPDILRKSFCSYHLAMFERPEYTAQQMGHVRGLQLMNRHYRVPVTKEEAKKYWSIHP